MLGEHLSLDHHLQIWAWMNFGRYRYAYQSALVAKPKAPLLAPCFKSKLNFSLIGIAREDGNTFSLIHFGARRETPCHEMGRDLLPIIAPASRPRNSQQ